MGTIKRVLIYGMTENCGGVEAFIMNYFRNMDRSKLMFDFVIGTEHIAYEDEIKLLGGRIFKISRPSEGYMTYRKNIIAFFKEHACEYVAFWMNVNILVNMDYLKLAKKYGIPKLIIHSHNSKNMASVLKGIMHRVNRLSLERLATDYWACSSVAADWFYVGKLRQRVKIVHNAIDIDAIKYNEAAGKEVRTEWNLKDSDYVIGNVGRLHFQKNQSFILEIFSLILKETPNVRLVFVGDGEDRQMLIEKCEKLGLKGKVIFAGIRNDIGNCLSAFDMFLFPSLFEGMPISFLEAEANGLPIIMSDTIQTSGVMFNDNIKILSLEDETYKWVASIRESMKYSRRISPDEIEQTFSNSDYDIRREAKKLEKIMFSK